MPGDCWIGWDSVGCNHAFIWPFGFRGSVAKLCWLFPPCDVSHSMEKSASGECHGCRVLENCIGGLSLCGKEELASWFLTCSSDMVSGGFSTWEVQGPNFQGENTQGLALIGCAWQLSCWRRCFVSTDFSPGWKSKIYDPAMMVFVHGCLLGGVAFWRSWTFGAILVVLVLMLQGIYHCSGAFSFSVILLPFLVVCIRIATRALHCCRGC
jgi:hypothetical protein